MAITKSKAKTRTITRNCVLCSKPIKITVYPDHNYRGGHYFDFGKPTSEETAESEYWECNKCCGRVG